MSRFAPVLATDMRNDEKYSYGELEKKNLCRQLLLDAGADPTVSDGYGGSLATNILWSANPVRANTLLETHFPDTFTKSSIRAVWGHGIVKIWASISNHAAADRGQRNRDNFAIVECGRCPGFCGHRLADLAYYMPTDSWGPVRASSAPGDIFDASLARCGLNIESSRRNSGKARIAHYSKHYRRRDFERLWVGFEHLCPYWDDKPWPADLASLEANSCEKSEDEASDNSIPPSSSEDGDYYDEEMETGAAGSDTAPASTVLSGNGLATSRQRARSAARLPSLLADIVEAEYSSDSEVEVIREIVPEHFVIEHGAEFSFDFAQSS